jgi:hypothetical protein
LIVLAFAAGVLVLLLGLVLAVRHIPAVFRWSMEPVPAFCVIRNIHVVLLAAAVVAPGLLAMYVSYSARVRDNDIVREQFQSEIRDIQRNELTRDQVSKAIHRIVKLEAPSEREILRIVRRGIKACADDLPHCPVREFVNVLNRVLHVDLRTGAVRPMPVRPPARGATTTVVRPTTTVQKTTTVVQPAPPPERGGQLDSDVLRGTDEKIAAVEALVQNLTGQVAQVASRVQVLDRLIDVLCRTLRICIR